MIKPTGFFRAKSDTLIKLGAALAEQFDGEVPHTLAELVTLPGVGRKTANVVLGNGFDVPGHHRGHPFRPAGPAVRLDHRERAGQDRGRGRRPVPTAGLDPALPQRDLARPPALPRPQPRLRRLPGRPLLSVLR